MIALCDARGQLVQGLTLPLHLGSVPEFMRRVLARFGGQMCDGDVYGVVIDPQTWQVDPEATPPLWQGTGHSTSRSKR